MPELLIERQDLQKPAPISSGWERKTLFEAIAHAFQSYPEPLLLILDDLQWCDQDTLEWLGYYVHFTHRTRILIVASMRSEEFYRTPAITTLLEQAHSLNRLIDITIDHLNATETALLTQSLLKTPVHETRLQQIYEQTEGNPLFVIESIRAEQPVKGSFPVNLLEKELDQADHLAQALALSPKMAAIFQTRLDHLSPSARELAGIAATIDQAFSLELITLASGLDEMSVVQAIDELWQHHIIRKQGMHSYDFTHDRIREIVYVELGIARRQVHHRRVAYAIEQTFVGNRNAIIAQLARHYDYGSRIQEAIAGYQQAAIVAYETYSTADVIHFLKRAHVLLGLLPETTQRQVTELEILTLLGSVLTEHYGFAIQDIDTERVFKQAWQLCIQLDTPLQSIPVLAGLWLTTQMLGNLNEAMFWSHTLATLAQEKYPAFIMISCFACAGVHLFSGAFEIAQKYCIQGIQSDLEYTNQAIFTLGYEPYTVIHCYLALAKWFLGDHKSAYEYMHQAQRYAQQSPHFFESIFVLGMTSVLMQLSGNLQASYDYATQVSTLAQEKNALQWQTHAQALIGWTQLQHGNIYEGLAQIQEHIANLEAQGAKAPLTYYYLLLIEAYTLQGKITEGLGLVTQMLTHIQSSNERWLEAEIYRWQGELLAMQADCDQQSEAAFRQALEIAQQQGALSLALRSASSLCRFQQQRHLQADARTLLKHIYEQIPHDVLTPDLQQAQILLNQR